MTYSYVVTDQRKKALMDEFFETVTVRPKVTKMLMFEEIFKRAATKGRKKSMYRIGKHPNSHMRRGGGRFKHTDKNSTPDMFVDAHSSDAPLEFRRAAHAFKHGGASQAGVELDKRARSDAEHQKVMTELLNTKNPKANGMTLAEALAAQKGKSSTHHILEAGRHRYHKKKIDETMDNEHRRLKKWGINKPAAKREAHLVIGLPGAGKSTLSDVLQRQHKALLLDSDEIKQRLDGFDNGLGAGVVHEESSMLSKFMKQQTLKKGLNFVMPVVGGNPHKLTKAVKELQKNGYKVTVHHVDVPPKFAEERVVRRYLHKTRAVPLSAVTDAGTKTRTSFDTVRSTVNGWAAYTAHDVPGGGPIRYAVLGTKGYKLPKTNMRNKKFKGE